MSLSRRDFLRLSGATAGALVVTVDLTRDAHAGADFVPSAWVRIAPDGKVTITVAEAEIGQGVTTSIPMLIADALDADWNDVSFELADAEDKYGRQSTGGSTSIRRGAVKLREAGAVAREVLVTAAATTWKVDPKQCTTKTGSVVHPDGTKTLGYGALVADAAKLPIPEAPSTPPPISRGIAGTPKARFDIPAKVNGSATFGLDVNIPGALVARVKRCPVFGGEITSFDGAEAKKVPGVRHVLKIPNAVAVVADDYWSATLGLRKLKVSFSDGGNGSVSSQDIHAAMKRALKQPGTEAHDHGDVEKALQASAKRIEATYEVPFLAHAPMEPLNFTAHVTAKRAELWGPTQVLSSAKQAAVRITGLPDDDVVVHPTYIGGGFGRRLEVDYVEDAVEIAKRIDAPVKVVWSRPDEIRHGAYRPAALSHFRAGLDRKGKLVAWHNRIVSPSILAGRGWSGSVDGTSVEGAKEIPYAVDHMRVEYHRHDSPVPVGFWRSVGSSQNAYFTEAFFDEVARAAGEDPLAYRLRMLGSDKRYRQVLELVADKAGWRTPPPAGVHRGIAVAKSFGSYAAHVVEVTVGKTVEVKRVVCAVDCGHVVNPDTVAAQLEGGAIFGLSAALESRISVAKGSVVESNFHDFRVLRMNAAPDIEVHIVPSNEAWGGVGEPGVPSVAPAVANAVLAATGNPARKLPITISGGAP